jgi:hypothetical protein
MRGGYRHTVALQQRQALVDDLDKMINRPAPPPEPEPQIVYVVEENRDPTKLDYPTLNRWFAS